MGLDMYFYEIEGNLSQDYVKGLRIYPTISNLEELAYFRKAYALNNYLREIANQRGVDLGEQLLLITREDIEKLLKSILNFDSFINGNGYWSEGFSHSQLGDILKFFGNIYEYFDFDKHSLIYYASY